MKKRILLFGCTGSIGRQTLDIARQFPDTMEIAGLSAHTSEEALLSLGKESACRHLCLTGKKSSFSGIYGADNLPAFIEKSGADIAVNGIAGSAGLLPSVYALEAGIDLALANKETIVMAGSLIKALAKKHRRRILPVDSEHSAVFQLLERFPRKTIQSVILTASGGPFRTLGRERFAALRPEDALKHPTWNMGKKITIDSATLANKGLEVIEARYLFDLPVENIKVVIHPQSMAHSLIRTVDGTLYAQISRPDMRRPLLNALTWPSLAANELEPLDLASGGPDGTGLVLSFFPPRYEDFPLLGLAFEAAQKGQGSCVAYNAANEEAVTAFLAGKIPFTGFAPVVKSVMERVTNEVPRSFDDVFAIDRECRERARGLLKKPGGAA
jgi:1-deoxy-D-xylulose-5-phosphate reductoisomerase